MLEDPKLCIHHKNYSILSYESQWQNFYSHGVIESIKVILGTCDSSTNERINKIIVKYRNGETYKWKTKYISVYNMGQFGIAVSPDGSMVFVQTWENGLFCFDAKTGERIWRTKSRRGITNIFVGDNTITAQLHEYAMQLIDIKTGEVIKEKRPCTSWGFNSLDNKHIICRVTARCWEIIEAETLEVKESFAHKVFTDNHTELCINHISLCENGNIRVRGFKNVWDTSTKPPKMLPDIEFEHFLVSKYFDELKGGN